MAIDPREITAVAHVLQRDHEGKSVEQVAEECIKAMRTLEGTATRTAMGIWSIGDCFRSPIYPSPLIVAWMGDQYSWLVGKSDSYGLVTCHDAITWRWRENARITDGVKAKALTNKDGHIIGDMFMYFGKPREIVAVCMGGVLFVDEYSPYAVPNEDVARFYRKVD